MHLEGTESILSSRFRLSTPLKSLTSLQDCAPHSPHSQPFHAFSSPNLSIGHAPLSTISLTFSPTVFLPSPFPSSTHTYLFLAAHAKFQLPSPTSASSIHLPSAPSYPSAQFHSFQRRDGTPRAPHSSISICHLDTLQAFAHRRR